MRDMLVPGGNENEREIGSSHGAPQRCPGCEKGKPVERQGRKTMGLRSTATKAATSPNRGKDTMGMNNVRKHGIAAAVSLIVGGVFASAGTARADGPGIGALTYTSAEVSGTAPLK